MRPTDAAAGWRALVIEGRRHAVRLAGFDQPLQVALADGTTVTLPPWRYGDHLAALRAGLHPAVQPAGYHPTATAVGLDPRRYLAAMPAYASAPAVQQLALLPVALWWAGGGDAAAVQPGDADGWTDIDGRRWRLSPWRDGQRQQAMRACLALDEGQGQGQGEGGSQGAAGGSAGRFDAVGYLDAMVRHTVQWDRSGSSLDELASHWALPLIDAVVALNLARPEGEPRQADLPGAQATAVQTLRLCQALGWTPSQVWATPAVEVDRLLDLLDRVEPAVPARFAAQPRAAALPAARGRPRLADQPDAVLIRIED